MTTIEKTLEALGFRPAADIGITVTETPPAYRVKGVTDDVTDCDNCPRTDLKKTVILACLDADGNEADTIHVGTHCAATLAGRPYKEIAEEVEEVEIRQYRARIRETNIRFQTWMRDNYGVEVPVEIDRRYWHRPIGPFKNFYVARAAFTGKI